MRRRLVFLAFLALLAIFAIPRIWSPLSTVALASVPELQAPLRSTAEHDARSNTHPYIVDVPSRRGHAVVLGVRHTRQADDPQITALRNQFEIYEPSLVLVEGRLGWHFGGPSSLLDRFGESGEAVALAHADGIPYRSMEPDFRAEVQDAVSAFGKQKTLAFYALRVFISERDQGLFSKAAIDVEMAELLAKRARRTGLIDALPDIAALDAFWKTHGTGAADWRKLPAKALWRTAGAEWPQQLAERINAFRDRAFVAAITDAVSRGERVLAVCGSSHAILFEPALRAAIAKLE